MEGNEENVIVGWELEWGDGKREALEEHICMLVEGSGRRRDGCRRDILEKVRD